MKMLFMLVFVLSLFGCATGPTAIDFASADYGQVTKLEDIQPKVIELMSVLLKDPDSAKYKWVSFKQGWVRDSILNGSQVHFGYELVVLVNAKNSYGGYAGFQLYDLLFYNGQITVVNQQQPDGILLRIR